MISYTHLNIDELMDLLHKSCPSVSDAIIK